MTSMLSFSAGLSDQQLLAHVRTLAARERRSTAELIASLAEVDDRQLYLLEGFSSLFKFCTNGLHMGEEATYNRIEVARAARRWPIVVEMLADGQLTLTVVRLLAPHLTQENHRRVLDAATHRGKREVERQVAALRPLPAVPSIVRKLPMPRPLQLDAPRASGVPGASSRAPETNASTVTPRALITPLAPERYKIQITVSREMHDKLRRVQDLMRHQVPNGDPAVILERALSLLLEQLERKRLAAAKCPRRVPAPTNPHSRHVPAAVRREVWRRDGGQCAFVGTSGRCTERSGLEIHHVIPFADGGPTTVDNLQLRCRAHNAYEAKERFGPFLLREWSVRYGADVREATRSGTT